MDVSRYEVNNRVRTVLIRHYIDLTRIDYSCIGHTVYLSGVLLNNSENDLSPAVIESLLKEISRLSNVHNVQCDFKNWNISSEENAWQITKSKRKLRNTGGVMEFQLGVTSEAAKDVYIKSSEKIADVLKDIRKNPEQE